MRKILAFTSIRSDYDLMSGVYRRLAADPQVELRLLVSGAHLSPAHGLTMQQLRADGLPVLAEVETLISADSPSARLKTAANLLAGTIDLVRGFAPDLLVLAGDREDVLVGAMLGGFLHIPVAHFFGGDHACDGHIDNPVRHAVSKLANVHLVSLPEHRERLLALGEPAERIHVIGSVALDKFVDEPTLPRAQLLAAMHAKPHAEQAGLAVLIFHPVEAERLQAGAIVQRAVDALVAQGLHVCIGAANTDPGSHGLTQVLQALGQRPEVSFYAHLSRLHFVNLLRQAQVIVGNSSAGLLEAASLPMPAVNIGARQRGRLCAGNVLFCGTGAEEIRAALQQALSEPFRDSLQGLRNPYGDGRSAARAAELLKTLPVQALLAKPEDPLHARR